MQKINIHNIDAIRQRDPMLAEALESIARETAHVADQTTATIGGTTPPPPKLASINVTAAGGIFEGALVDNGPVQRGINYFAEYSDSPTFVKPKVLDLGQSRNFRENLGNLTLFWRGYHGYPTSPRSDPVYHGGSATNPVAVVGGGATTGPALQASQGSGTSDGPNGGDGGFGNEPTRGK